MLPAVVGAVLALLTAVVIFGGVHRISFITSVLVPIMAGIYILVGVYVTVTNLVVRSGNVSNDSFRKLLISSQSSEVLLVALC